MLFIPKEIIDFEDLHNLLVDHEEFTMEKC